MNLKRSSDSQYAPKLNALITKCLAFPDINTTPIGDVVATCTEICTTLRDMREVRAHASLMLFEANEGELGKVEAFRRQFADSVGVVLDNLFLTGIIMSVNFHTEPPFTSAAFEHDGYAAMAVHEGGPDFKAAWKEIWHTAKDGVAPYLEFEDRVETFAMKMEIRKTVLDAFKAAPVIVIFCLCMWMLRVRARALCVCCC
jgi:hypothetical protein